MNMRKAWMLCIISCLFLLPGCTPAAEHNLTFCNSDGEPVGLVELIGEDYRAEGCRADGAPLRSGDSMGFFLDPDEGGQVTLRVWDQEHKEVVAEGAFRLDVAGEKEYSISLVGGRLVLEEEAAEQAAA